MQVNGRKHKLQRHKCCLDHCRDWSETHNGKCPPSDHSPGCRNFRPEKFVRIKDPDGGVMLWPAETAEEGLALMRETWLEECDGNEDRLKKIKIDGEVFLTDDQLDRMGEYEP